MKPFNYIFIGVLSLLLVSSIVGIFYIGELTTKMIFLIFVAAAASFVTNRIHHNYLLKRSK